MQEKGNISINTENIFPIIKKWLYSEKDIFLRELVSNSSDAISKLKKLIDLGEADIDRNTHFYIKVRIDKKNKTLAIIDNGIGMTFDEVKKYINQIAFSGAKDFIEKYRDKGADAQIIGHFGLGFYSAFMVSDKVQIDTLSYKSGEKAVRWISKEGTDYTMEDSDRENFGTTVTLTLSEDSLEFLEKYKVNEILRKYFSFLPIEIYLEDVEEEEKRKEEEEKNKSDKDNDKKDSVKSSDSEDNDNLDELKELDDLEDDVEDIDLDSEIESPDKQNKPKPINDTNPLWLKNPKDCTDEEYKEFYKKVFMDFEDPLFWIHLNLDYPFNLKGILYFPKLKHEFQTIEGQIKLYYNQVFVADNIKEVIPEFLMLLKGTIDCPDLPLNVSRSFLQNDGYVNKISTHITKKVADKLISLYENERENYEKFWDDINPFIKYGCIKEQKFYERVKDIIIFKTTSDDYVTLKTYLERNNDKHKDKVFYITDEKQQAQYIKMFKEFGNEAVYLSTMIDNHFISFIEMKETNVKFTRIDSDVSDSIKHTEETNKLSNEDIDALQKLFAESIGNQNLKTKVESLKASNVPGMIILSEQNRRMQEMSRMFGNIEMSNLFPNEETLILNSNNNLIKTLLKLKDDESKKDDVKMICEQVYDIAMMSHKQLDAEHMTRFIERSNKILEKFAGI